MWQQDKSETQYLINNNYCLIAVGMNVFFLKVHIVCLNTS